jgi:hypothetical protein
MGSELAVVCASFGVGPSVDATVGVSAGSGITIMGEAIGIGSMSERCAIWMCEGV